MDKIERILWLICHAALTVIAVVITVRLCAGCTSLKREGAKTNIATAIQTAYDLGGREAVSNKIESLVAEGKLTPSQAMRLHALAQLAYEGIVDDLTADGGEATNATPASASQDGCIGCSLPDASGGYVNECNEDANCGRCRDCTDK